LALAAALALAAFLAAGSDLLDPELTLRPPRK